jgi:hypothetical protein
MITEDGNIQVDRQIAKHLAAKGTIIKITSTNYFVFPYEECDKAWTIEEIIKHLRTSRHTYLLHEHYNPETLDIVCEIQDPIQPFGEY